jgi:hypothetical protein
LLRFTATVTVADVFQAFSWVDWIADDAETLEVVRGL